MSIKADFMLAVAKAITQAISENCQVTVAVPPSLSAETARNYAYATRNRMNAKVKISWDHEKVTVSGATTNPIDLLASATSTLTPAKQPGCAVLTCTNPTAEILAACNTLLNAGVLNAIEFYGLSCEDLEKAVAQAQLNLIASPCKTGSLLT